MGTVTLGPTTAPSPTGNPGKDDVEEDSDAAETAHTRSNNGRLVTGHEVLGKSAPRRYRPVGYGMSCAANLRGISRRN